MRAKLTDTRNAHQEIPFARYESCRDPWLRSGSGPAERAAAVPVRHTTAMPLSRLKLNELAQTFSEAGVPVAEVQVNQESVIVRQRLNYNDRGALKEYGDADVEHFKYTFQHSQTSSVLVVNTYTLTLTGLQLVDNGKRANYDVQPPAGYAIEAYVPESERYRWTMTTDSWDDAKQCTKQWADSVAEVIATPNLWEEARAAQASGGDARGQAPAGTDPGLNYRAKADSPGTDHSAEDEMFPDWGSQ
jgi:hypothetical protein